MVTATNHTDCANVIDLQFSGPTEPLGTTASHPFRSVSRLFCTRLFLKRICWENGRLIANESVQEASAKWIELAKQRRFDNGSSLIRKSWKHSGKLPRDLLEVMTNMSREVHLVVPNQQFSNCRLSQSPCFAILFPLCGALGITTKIKCGTYCFIKFESKWLHGGLVSDDQFFRMVHLNDSQRYRPCAQSFVDYGNDTKVE